MTNRLELNWKLDGFVDEQRYYCSESTINAENLPVPKVVLAGDVRTHVDTNIEVGKTYFVRIGSVKNGVEKISDEFKITILDMPVYLFNLIPSGNTMVDTSEVLIISGTSTNVDGAIHGTVTSATNPVWDFYKRVGAIEFEVKGQGNIAKDWGADLRFNLQIISETCYLNFYTSSPFAINQISFPVIGVASSFKKVKLVRNASGTFSAYVNDVEQIITGNDAFSFSGWNPSGSVPIGDSNLYIKYLRYAPIN